MEFSRIVTLYDQWHFLTWLQDDALFHSDCEYIFVDDGSPQPMPAELGGMLRARGIRIITLPRNAGRCIARNTGAQAAQGRYLDFIDGDDRPLPLFSDPAWADSQPEFVAFPFLVHGQGRDMQTSFVRHPLLAAADAPRGYLDPRPAAALWRRQYFLELGGFDARWELAEDLELIFRAMSGRRAFASRPKQSYNEQPRSTVAEISLSTQRLRLYQRLPTTQTAREDLLTWEARALFLQVTWYLLRRRQDRHLFRSALSLIWNLGKARLGLLPRNS